MTKKTDRITPLIFDRELTKEELEYWKQKEPEFFCDHHSPVNADPDWDEDEKEDEDK